MKTITIRDLRQRWPEAEKSLQHENEIVITRDGRPVAKLVSIVSDQPERKRWKPEEHKQWLRKVWRNKMMPGSDPSLARARADRWEKGE